MSTSGPGRTPGCPDSDDPGSAASFAAVDQALDSARREVVRATACWVTWAQHASRAIEDTDGPDAWATAWSRLRHVSDAVELAERALGDARRELTAARCPVCADPVIRGARIYDPDGTPHTCAHC
jgi:hypothetical protein